MSLKKRKSKSRKIRSKKQDGGATTQLEKDDFLLDAVDVGEIDKVEFALKNGADVNARNIGGDTALMIAIARADNGDLDLIRILLDHGADVDATNAAGDTALTLTDNRETIELLERFVESNLEPKCMSRSEYILCTEDGDEKPTDPILLEQVERVDAVKLDGQPNICYHRKTLRQWLKNSRTNPLTREPVNEQWIKFNMGKRKCKEEKLTIPRQSIKRKTVKRSIKRKTVKRSIKRKTVNLTRFKQSTKLKTAKLTK
jgi:hypothetical protein